MSRLKSRRPSASMIVAVIALVAAMAGGAYAQGNLPANSVGSKQLKKKAVKTNNLNGKAVTSGKIKSKSIGSGKVKSEAIKTNKIAPQAVTNSTLAHPVYWAYVTSGGGLDKANGATNAAVIGTGHREVSFETDVSGCIYLATPTYQSAGREIAANLDPADSTKVQVRIRTSSGTTTNSNSSFNLGVYC
ncbi:MAG: hypothetical protein ACR2N5_03350 [Solirubrobacterales bacterium]